MNTRHPKLLLAVVALAMTAAACGADTGAEGSDGGSDDGSPVSSAVCAEGHPDCEDTVEGDQSLDEQGITDGAGSSCLAGDTDCVDESNGGGDVTREVLLSDSSSGADAIGNGATSGASGHVIEQAYSADGTTLELTFSGGACDLVEDVLVTESDAEVRLLVLVGQDASADVCTAQVVQWTTTITLAAPLGDRLLLDLAG